MQPCRCFILSPLKLSPREEGGRNGGGNDRGYHPLHRWSLLSFPVSLPLDPGRERVIRRLPRLPRFSLHTVKRAAPETARPLNYAFTLEMCADVMCASDAASSRSCFAGNLESSLARASTRPPANRSASFAREESVFFESSFESVKVILKLHANISISLDISWLLFTISRSCHRSGTVSKHS